MEWKDASPNGLLELIHAIGGDGHSIYPVDWYVSNGAPEELIKPLEETMKSDFSHPKSTLFRNGKPVKELIGVYTLDVLRDMTDNLDLDEEARKLVYKLTGRGFKAQAMCSAIKEYLEALPEVVVREE